MTQLKVFLPEEIELIHDLVIDVGMWYFWNSKTYEVSTKDWPTESAALNAWAKGEVVMQSGTWNE